MFKIGTQASCAVTSPSQPKRPLPVCPAPERASLGGRALSGEPAPPPRGTGQRVPAESQPLGEQGHFSSVLPVTTSLRRTRRGPGPSRWLHSGRPAGRLREQKALPALLPEPLWPADPDQLRAPPRRIVGRNGRTLFCVTKCGRRFQSGAELQPGAALSPPNRGLARPEGGERGWGKGKTKAGDPEVKALG